MQKKLIQIIKKAGKILKKGYYSNKDVNFKAKKDLVTKYDLAVENYLKKEFSKYFKEFNLIAEESDNNLVEFGNSIIIDPIDGTTNFVNGVPHTAISVGVYKDKKPYIGVVYNPILDELYFAKHKKGAFLNGKKIKVSLKNDLQKSLLATGFPYSSGENTKDLKDVIKKIEKKKAKIKIKKRNTKQEISVLLGNWLHVHDIECSHSVHVTDALECDGDI